MSPDELSDDDFNDLSVDDVREIIADENRWMRTSIDAIPWPTAITIRPVEVNLVALAMARMGDGGCMSSCEKCWAAAYDPYGDQGKRYRDRILAHQCTPEEQAGPDAQWCADCGRVTLHQYTKQCMNTECDSVSGAT